MTSCVYSHWDGISMEAGICPLQISCEKYSIFLSYGVGCGKKGTTNCWPCSTLVWVASLSTQNMSRGFLLRGKVARRSRHACAVAPRLSSKSVYSSVKAARALSSVSAARWSRYSGWPVAHDCFGVDGGGGAGGVSYVTVPGRRKSGEKGGALPGMAPT